MFNLGNLITIGICLIILVLYRILDRDNRSLEKVKKYADKLQNDMAVWADQRAEDLKNYSIDLTVHQKAAEEVLRRVNVAEEDLSKNADKINGVASRITEYDAALAELKDMSAKVDANLSAIHDESAFVDGVFKNLKSCQSQLDAIKAEIPGIIKEINEEASKKLSELNGSFGNKVDEKLASVNGSIDALSKEIADGTASVEAINAQSVRTAEDRYLAIKKEINDAFERAKLESQKLEDAAFVKIKELIDLRSTKLSTAVTEKFTEIQDKAKAMIAENREVEKAYKVELGQMNEKFSNEIVQKSETIKSSAIVEVEKYCSQAVSAASATLEKTNGFVAEANELVANLKSGIESELGTLKSSVVQNSNEIMNKSSEVIKEIEQKISDTEKSSDEHYAKLAEKVIVTAQNMQEKVKEQLKAIQEDIVNKQSDVKATMKEGLLDTKATAEQIIKSFTDSVAQKEEEASTIVKNIEALLLSTEQKTNNSIESLSSSFDKNTKAIESNVLDTFQTKANEMREYVENGLNRLEAVRIDTQKLEDALRNTMAAVQERVVDKFKQYESGMQSRQDDFENSFKEELNKTNTVMKNLEDDLLALKSKAYNDVAEKLKVFEDEFFSDLKNRSASTDEKLLAWKNEMDEKLSNATREAELIQENTNKEWTNNARASLSETQSNIQERLENLASQVDAHRESISARVGEADQALNLLKASIGTDLEEARKAADVYLNAELVKWQSESSERIHFAERQSAQDEKKIAEENEKIRALYQEANVQISNEAEKIKLNFEKLMNDEQLARQNDIETFSNDLKLQMNETVKQWDLERKKFFNDAKDASLSLSKDVKNLSNDVDRFRHEFAQKTSQALEDFAKETSVIESDTEKKTRDALSMIESAVEDFNRKSKILKETIDTEHTKMTSILAVEQKEYEKTFADMDKTIKTFVAQTKLFERTDELKAALNEAIDSMKADFVKLESRRGEMTELENQYGRIKRSEDELGQKIARFLAEKRRFDAMENDFKKLLSLSQAVDQKISTVTDSSDQLTQIQAEFKRLAELADKANEKCERIEKKSNIMDSTADAIDNNFSAIENLEKRIRTIDANVSELPDQVISLKRSIEEIKEWQPELVNTINQLENMKTDLTSTEKKSQELLKNREWLVKAESRFEELNTKTQNHLNLLNAILKEEPKVPGDDGIPSLAVKENVRILAHKGYDVAKIAKLLKLSRGEVSLILDTESDKDD